MTLSNGALVLHLGTIDESLVRNQDYYICIRSIASNVESALYVCWRASSINESGIIYRKLDPDKDPITPLYIEMLAGEELPHLLQTLLVGVEHAICRIPLDELTFPPCPPIIKSTQQKHSNDSIDNGNDNIDDKSTASGKQQRLECNLKRRELITKNNSINKKYTTAVKRITCNGTSSSSSIECDNESETTALDGEIIVKESVDSTNDILNGNDIQHSTDTTITSTLPLFCLGGSFPHIDSDEESGDDSKKSQSGKF